MKNWFTSKPYWFRGGLIAISILSISFIYFLLSAFLGYFIPIYLINIIIVGFFFFPYVASELLLLPAVFGDNRLLFTGKLNTSMVAEPTTLGIIISTIPVFLVYFAIGAFVGLIIGKHKKRAENNVRIEKADFNS